MIKIFGHKNPDTDTIVSAMVLEKIEKADGKNVKAYRLGNVNKETEYALNYFGMDAPELLEKVEEGDEVELVDHNEFPQSVDGIENAKILRVVDHHRISDFKTSEPLDYMAKPFGCTATILYEICKYKEIDIDKPIAGLMASAIISDTLLLKSPTCTEKDKDALKELSEIAEIDANKYGLDMLKAGTDLSSFSIDQILNLDAKEVMIKDIKTMIDQVNTASIPDVMKMQNDLEAGIEKIIEEKNLDLFMLLITDIVNSNSQVIALGKKANVVEKAYGVKLENNTALLNGVVSRKKQVIPIITENA